MAARSVRDAEVVGSNPTVPTQKHQRAARKGGPLVWGPIPSRLHRTSDESAAGITPFAAQESFAEGVGGCPISLRGRLGVDGQGEAGVGVAEAGLGGLQVNAFVYESGGVGPAEVVEPTSGHAVGDPGDGSGRLCFQWKAVVSPAQPLPFD